MDTTKIENTYEKPIYLVKLFSIFILADYFKGILFNMNLLEIISMEKLPADKVLSITFCTLVACFVIKVLFGACGKKIFLRYGNYLVYNKKGISKTVEYWLNEAYKTNNQYAIDKCRSIKKSIETEVNFFIDIFINIINYFKEDYTIYIFDYPGFGNSPYPTKTLTIHDYTNIIRDFIKEKNIINPTIIAHSFGGRITTLLTGYYKEQINKLILIDIATIKPKKTPKQLIKEKTYKFLRKLIKLTPKLKQEKYNQKLLSIFGSTDYKNLPQSMHNTFKNIINTMVWKLF